MELGLCWGRSLGSGAEAESKGNVGPPIDQTARGTLNLLKNQSAGSTGFPELSVRVSTNQKPPGAPFLVGVHPGPPPPQEWGLSGLALGLVTFASPFHMLKFMSIEYILTCNHLILSPPSPPAALLLNPFVDILLDSWVGKIMLEKG